MVIDVTTEDFRREVLDAGTPVVVDFYADWCVSCKALAPEFEALSQEWAGHDVRFVQLNVDKAPELAAEYGVSSIPTVLLFEGGEVSGRTVGAKPGHQVAAELGLEDAVDRDGLGVACAC